MKIYDGIIYKIIEMPESFNEKYVDREVMEVYEKVIKDNLECEVVIRFTKVKQIHKSEISFVNKLSNKIKMVNGKLFIIDASEAVENALRYQKIDPEILIFRELMDFENIIGSLIIDDDDLVDTELAVSFNSSSNEIDSMEAKRKLHALIIADSIMDRNNQKASLEKIEFIKNISLAKGCGEGTKIIQNTVVRIDLILVDFGSMKASCKSMLKSVRTFKSTKEVKIILTCSNKVNDTEIKNAMENGADGFIPINASAENYKKLITKIFFG